MIFTEKKIKIRHETFGLRNTKKKIHDKVVFILLTHSFNINERKSYNYLIFPLVEDLQEDISVKRTGKGENC